MAKMDEMPKDPDSEENFSVSWNTRLQQGVGIATSAWSISGYDSALTFAQAAISPDLRATSVQLSGGTANYRYLVRNRIVTDEAVPQTMDHTFAVMVLDE